MNNKYCVRIMRTEIQNFKNISYGEVTYMNHGSINSNGSVCKNDVIGIYGQNGSGKTALVEALDILRCCISGTTIPYDVYEGILSRTDPVMITTDFFVESQDSKYKVEYTAYIRANEEKKRIELYKEKLLYWTKGAKWKDEHDIEFENPYYDNEDLLSQMNLCVKSEHPLKLQSIGFLFSMQNLALVCSQINTSVLFNPIVLKAIKALEKSKETVVFTDVIKGIMQFGSVDLNVIKVNQLGAININQLIPINVHSETESTIMQVYIPLGISGATEIPAECYDQVQSAIAAINIALRSIVPNLQMELEKKMELEKPDGTKSIQLEVYSIRDQKRFLMKYESEGIKRIISILNYLISVFNDPGVCLVVDELDSGIFEYLLGELLGMMNKEMKGQLIFTSHNLRILEKLDSKNIICSTTNPNNRYIRLTGIEKNNNKRDFYIRAITVGGQKEELYDEDDLLAMGYAFRKAGKTDADRVKLQFSQDMEEKLNTQND